MAGLLLAVCLDKRKQREGMTREGKRNKSEERKKERCR
jgi:hypothetical protein